MKLLTRKEFLQLTAILGITPTLLSFLSDKIMMTRPIPRTKEMLPVVGLGTWQTFDVGQSEKSPLKDVLQTLIEKGANVIDSSPMYGQSEKVVGELSEELRANDKLFLATKVWTTGVDAGVKQMQKSMLLLKRKKLDLMQIHNLVDWKNHLRTLENWKENGTIRYIGITHYLDSAHTELEQIIKHHPIDFLQINYSINARNAERSLLSTAQEKGVAVLINRPFDEGNLFQQVKRKELPEWASEFDCYSWSQFFLKFILSHPAVNCVIPGTSKVHHLVDNCGAGYGRLPDAKQRERMIKYIQ